MLRERKSPLNIRLRSGFYESIGDMTSDQFGGLLLGAIPFGIGLWQLMEGKVITRPNGRSIEVWDKEDFGPDLFYFSVIIWMFFGAVIWWAVFIKGPELCRKEKLQACQTTECRDLYSSSIDQQGAKTQAN